MDSNNNININSSNITNEEENKRIDNRILTTKERINSIDEKLDNAKKRIRNLADMQENVESIAKSMNKCIDLLSKSVKGPKVNAKFNDMRNSNKLFLIKATASIEDETMTVRKSINELYKEKDMIIKENRDEFNRENQLINERKAAMEAREKIFNEEKEVHVDNPTEDIEE